MTTTGTEPRTTKDDAFPPAAALVDGVRVSNRTHGAPPSFGRSTSA
jgi:hypothetical protein